MKIKIALLSATLALVAAVAAIIVLPKTNVVKDRITIGGVQYDRSVTELKLSGSEPEMLYQLEQLVQLQTLDLRETELTAEDYHRLKTALPDCEILWSPIFQGKAYPQDTTVLTADTLTADDLKQLDDFPALKQLDATGCRDYALLRQLQADRPALEVIYSVFIGNMAVPHDTETLTLSDAGEELFGQLTELPQLTQVELTGTLPAPEFLEALAENYPGIAFYWETELFGTRYGSETEEIDLTGMPLEDTAEIEAAIPYLPHLQKVILCDCGLDTDVMGPLQERHPELKFVWWLDLGAGNRVRTDAAAFCAEPYGVKLYDSRLWQLKYCDQMVCLDLGHMPITDCSFVANMPKIKYLILAISQISDLTPLSNATELVFLEIFKTEVVDYTPLLNCTALEDLNVCGSIGAEWETLTRMTWLKRLYLGWDGTSQRTADTIAEALPDTQVVLDPKGGSTGSDWRKGQHYYDMRDMLGKYYMEQ